MAVPKQRINKD